jgi:hypothetical protein
MSRLTDRLYAEWRACNGSVPRSPWLADALALGRRLSENNGDPKGPTRPAPQGWGQGAGAAGPRSTAAHPLPSVDVRARAPSSLALE